MKSIFLFVLLIFGVSLVTRFVTCKNNCRANEYKVVYSNGTFKRCLSCAKCFPGLELETLCGSTIQHPPDNIKCVPCKVGTFSSQYDSSPCYTCHQCVEHEFINASCSDKSDTVCSGKCEKGYFLRKRAPHNCQKCCKCVMDGNDEKIAECIDQGLSEHCSARPDKECESSGPGGTGASKGGRLSTTTISVISVVSVGFVVVLAMALGYMYYRKRKRHRRPSVHIETQPEARVAHTSEEQRNGRTSPQAYAVEGPQTDSKVTFVLPSNGQNPTYHGSRDELKVDNSVPPLASADPGEVSVKLPDEKESSKSRPPLCRQGSQESQKSGDGEAKFRKRSGSSISLEKLKRKLSERDDSLIEEDPDLEEAHEPIKIVKHPQSQTAKEGTKVELKCKVEGKRKNLLYQWFKDDVEVIGQNGANLVLEAVELKDFGRYTCCVSYPDALGESEKSSPATLDVIPQKLNGMRPKLLAELDISTRDDVASLLENKRFSLGGYRQVAAKFGMKDRQIEALDNSKEPGKDLMEFLLGSKPNLTVYRFCKTLKEDKIERCDIVKFLESHFLIREGTEYV